MEQLSVNILLGKVIYKIENLGDEMIFYCIDETRYKMFHQQDCCESVTIEDIAGDLDDLLHSPILKASEDMSHDNPEGISIPYQDSFTWTFYNLATMKGHVTIRWYGESNGYYSETVDFIKI